MKLKLFAPAILAGVLATAIATDSAPWKRLTPTTIAESTGDLTFVRVYSGVLRSGEWGWIQPKSGGPSWAGLSPTIWLIIGGLFVIWVFFRWQARRESHGEEPLVRTAMLRNKQLTGGLTMFFFQFLIQAGFFFVVPLFLSVALGLSAIDTGIRLLPLSVTLLAAAIGIPKLFPQVSPRLVVRLGLLSLLAGTVVLLGGLDGVGHRSRSGAQLATSPPDREHGPTQDGDHDEERERDPRERVTVVDDVHDPEHEADRGQPEVAEDQRRPDPPALALLHAAAADPDRQQDEASRGGDDPADECGPFHLDASFLGLAKRRILGDWCSLRGSKGTFDAGTNQPAGGFA
jgi:hypothetical protein